VEAGAATATANVSTSFKCSPISIPRRRCSSSATRPRHSARQASAALSLMRLSPATKTHKPRPLIQRRVVTYKMVPGILCARTGQKTTNKYVMVPIVYRPDQRRTHTIARLHNRSRRYMPPLAF
jgi:hypothetical protein